MKPGLTTGQTAEVEITVTADMLAAFNGEPVHDLYSTSALVHHMEWASRRLLLPYLEDHEEGMGSHVEVSHLALTLPGMKVRVKARVIEVRENKVVCEVEAFNPRGKIARGTVTQAVVEKSWLARKIKELSLIHQLAQQA
ncbi:MAG TPA: thioesterase family protein [Candidatus Obscuribacterales bacterium]